MRESKCLVRHELNDLTSILEAFEPFCKEASFNGLATSAFEAFLEAKTCEISELVIVLGHKLKVLTDLSESLRSCE